MTISSPFLKARAMYAPRYPKVLENISDRKALGLSNVKKQLELLYPSKHQLNIINKSNSFSLSSESTSVRVRVENSFIFESIFLYSSVSLLPTVDYFLCLP